MDWIFTREAVVALAILGALLSVASSLPQSRLSTRRARQLNFAGYGFMGASMLLFIIIGLRS